MLDHNIYKLIIKYNISIDYNKIIFFFIYIYLYIITEDLFIIIILR